MVVGDGCVCTVANRYVRGCERDNCRHLAFADDRFNGLTFVWRCAARWLRVMVRRTPCRIVAADGPVILPGHLVILGARGVFSLDDRFAIGVNDNCGRFQVFERATYDIFCGNGDLQGCVVRYFFVFFRRFFFRFICLHRSTLAVFRFYDFSDAFRFFCLLLFLDDQVEGMLLWFCYFYAGLIVTRFNGFQVGDLCFVGP